MNPAKSTHKLIGCTIRKYSPLKKCSKPFIPPQTDGMIRFPFNIGCSESKVIFKRRKKANVSNKNALRGANVLTSCFSLRTPATNKHSQHTEKPALSLRQGMRRSLRRTFFRPEVHCDLDQLMFEFWREGRAASVTGLLC